jgi:hypothetical protein
MGLMVSITCKDCKKKDKYYEGIGEEYFPENVFYKTIYNNEKPIIYDLISDEIINNIKIKLEKGAIPGEEYGHYFYYCKICKIIENHFYFSLIENGKIYTPVYECKICKNNVERIINFDKYQRFEFEKNPNVKIENLEIKCKRCGGNNIIIKEYGEWD